jgi:D-alanine-D-alanine ligase
LGWPVFTKPANGGSSVGISKVRSAAELDAALSAAFAHDRKVVVEKGLDVREIECAVMGNDRPEVSVCGEIVPSGEFYDYAAKYEDGTSQLFIPAQLPPELATGFRGLAVEAFQALELPAWPASISSWSGDRPGVSERGETRCPASTPISMYPKLWEASGVSYAELLARLIDLARRARCGRRAAADET